MDRITKVKANPAKRIRLGLWRCGDCKRQFTVKVGTVFEHARLPLNKALQAVYLMTSSKKGISAHQLHRVLEVTYKTAWFLAHRIREAMRSGDLAPFGGEGGVVEVDETFIGRKEGVQKRRGGCRHKVPVLSLVHRESGQSRIVRDRPCTSANIIPIVQAERGPRDLHPDRRSRVYSTSSATITSAMAASITRRANMAVAASTPIRLRAVSRSSSAA